MCSIFSASAQVSGSAQFSASAQLSASLLKKKEANVVCLEKGHNLTHYKINSLNTPYIINTPDSTVTVYPASTTTFGVCERCGSELESSEKDVRITTWRRVETSSYIPHISPLYIDWGYNEQRALNLPVITNSLDELKKVATLKDGVLYIHKRIAPFTSIEQQIKPDENLTVYYKNKPITFKTAVFDDAAFFAGKNGTEIY